jgi:FtsH-binding integral membrane protein
MPTYPQAAYNRGSVLTGDQSRAVFGQVMGLVALTVGFAALGAYIGRNVNSSFFIFLPAIGCLFGVQWATRSGRQQLAIALLFARGLLLGISIGAVIHYYAATKPDAVYQAAGTTAIATLGLGAIGYTTQHDLSRWQKPLLFALIGLIVFGLIASFVAIPGGNIIYCVAGIGIFSMLTVFDFWRLQRAGMQAAPLIAASIFLDVLNIFLLLLSLFGGGGRR